MTHPIHDLIAASEVMRDTSGYDQKSHQQQVTSTQWSAWCKQLKEAKGVVHGPSFPPMETDLFLDQAMKKN